MKIFVPNLQQLFKEHREILEQVDALGAEVGAIVDGPWRKVRDGVSQLAETLRRHERDEEDLFSEAFYSDLGRS